MTDRTDGPSRGPLDRKVLDLAPQLRSHLAVSTAVAAVVAVAVLAQAELLSRLLPRLIDGDHRVVAPLVAGLVAVALARAAGAGTVEGSASRALIATRTRVRAQVLDHVARIRPDQRAELGPARVSALTTAAPDALEPWVRAYLPSLVMAVVVPLAAGLRILGADILSAVVLAVVVPLVPIFMVLIGKATEERSGAQWEALQRLTGRFLDTLAGLATLRMFGRADAQVERVREVTERYRQATMRTLRVAFLSALVLELLATLSVALVAVSLGIRLSEGHLSLQTALVVLLLAPECLLPIRRVSAAFHAAAAGTDAARDIGDALDVPVRTEGDAALPPTGRLEALGVTVDDPARGTRLSGVDLSVGPGELVAVSGPSGAGKSTLLDVARGAILPAGAPARLGTVSVADIERHQRTAAIVWVPQRPRSLGETVAGSAAIGHPSGPATQAAVAETLEELGLGPLADRRPAEVSGGELRRVALARALVGTRLGSARFLLLDEPTAQLDPAAGALVIAALRAAAARGAGVAVATHDPILLASAHRVVPVIPPDRALPDRSAPALEAEPVGHEPAPARPTPTAPAPGPPLLSPSPPGGDTRAPGLGEIDAPDAGAIRWLLSAARPARRRLLGAQALGIAAETCTVGLMGTAAWLIARAAERPSFADLAVAAVAVRAFGLGKGVLRYGERLASHDAALRMLAQLRATVVARLARLAPTGLPAGGQGDLLARLVDDVDRLQDLFLRVLGPLVSALAVAAGAVVVAALIDPGAGAALAVSVALTGLALPLVAFRTARTRGRAAAAARGVLATSTLDLASHVEELVACGAEPAWRARVEADARVVDRLDRRQAGPTAAIAAVGAAAPALATAAVVAALGAGAGISGPAVCVLALLPLAVLELVGPLPAAGDALARVEASAARVRALLDRPDPVPEPAHPAPAPTRADVALADVSAGWPGTEPQVTGIDLTLAPGERVVISGPSGSGKSTVAALLVAFLAPRAGTYAVGGVASAELGGEAVRQLVTWCQQEPWFADSSLADNLRVARPRATDQDLWDQLEVVHLGAWARQLPDGLETRLGRDAEAVSGGERQRLALARALLGDRRVLVLDEPTAHLDGETAAGVLEHLLAATADRAVVVMAHDATLEGIGSGFELHPSPGQPSVWVRHEPDGALDPLGGVRSR